MQQKNDQCQAQTDGPFRHGADTVGYGILCAHTLYLTILGVGAGVKEMPGQDFEISKRGEMGTRARGALIPRVGRYAEDQTCSVSQDGVTSG